LRYSTARILNFSLYAMGLSYHLMGLFASLVGILDNLCLVSDVGVIVLQLEHDR